MMKMTPLDRILLLTAGVLAAYQVAVGINGYSTLPVIAYTISFGVLLVAGLLLIILGFEVLSSPVVVIVSTIIPLSLSLGLVWQHLHSLRVLYLAFAVLGFLAIILTRSMPLKNKLPTLVLAGVHAVAGLVIFLLPVTLSLQGLMKPLYALVGLGGAFIGIGGLLLFFLRTGRPVLSQATILRILPGLLLFMTIFFVTGFAFG